MHTNIDKWHTTIETLILNFRCALVAILPYMDAVRIGWRDGDAYDDWDEVASTLYRNIVEKSILHSGVINQKLKLAPYDLLIPSYNQYMYIIVSSEDYENLVFVGFSTQKTPFDFVKCVSILHSEANSEEIFYIPVEACRFGLAFGADDKMTRVTDISIDI